MTLMLAEDNQMSVLFMRQLLAKWDLDPEIVFDGDEAVDLVRTGHQFDVILMDIHMPRMNGLEAVELIRDWERHNGEGVRAYIIALTASVSDQIINKLGALGFDDYLGKPFNPNDLKHKLEIAASKMGLSTSESEPTTTHNEVSDSEMDTSKVEKQHRKRF